MRQSALSVALLSLASCGLGTVTGTPDSANVADAALTIPGSGVLPWRLVGRMAPGPDAADAPQTLSWANSTVIANFTGSATLRPRVTAMGTVFFRISVDGGVPQDFNPAVSTPTFAGLDPAATHQVTLVKRTEAAYGNATFSGFDLDPTGSFVISPEAWVRRIEVIGDSISVGYGDLGPNAFCNGAATNEDATRAYGPLLAETLHADLHLIAWSGKGVYRNNDKSLTETMPEIWQRTVATQAGAAWDFDSWQPQAVVVNLGTNDYYPADNPSNDDFTGAYTDFLEQIRQAYPQTYIVALVGPMLYGSDLAAATANIQAAVRARNGAGDKNVGFLQQPTQVVDTNSGAGAGCDYHPDLSTQQSMARTTAAFLRRKLGW